MKHTWKFHFTNLLGESPPPAQTYRRTPIVTIPEGRRESGFPPYELPLAMHDARPRDPDPGDPAPEQVLYPLLSLGRPEYDISEPTPPFTGEELDLALQSSRNSSCPGLDALPYTVFKTPRRRSLFFLAYATLL